MIVSLLPVIRKLFAEFGALPNAGFLLPAIVTIPSLVFAIFWPVAGVISDRYRRRQSFVGSRELILASRALLGIAEAFAITISSALIEDYFGEDCHHSTAWVGVSTSIAATALIAVGGALADVSWSGPFAIHIAAIPALIMAILVIEEPHTSAKPVGTSQNRLDFPGALPN
ncbi:hypothetical protein IP81_08210 [Novosphingobium sp. AAP83]|nr:hypothetical protein IP81_08210 [Novosphingobium sp. AAP83]